MAALQSTSAFLRAGRAALLRAPLCPAGHLPRKGGDQPSLLLSPIANIAESAPNEAASLISPLAGEMSGRTEGDNVEHCPRWNVAHYHQWNVRHCGRWNVQHCPRWMLSARGERP